MIVGDFNSHNDLWGWNKTDAKGRVMETFMTRSNICLFNDETPTYLHPATGSFISIDLTMCSPSLFMDFTWRVEDDLHGSDHHFKYLCSEAFLQDSLDEGLKLKIAL